MVGLPNSTAEPLWTRTKKKLRRTLHRSNKAIMKSHRLHIPKYDMPLRIRLWFLLFTSLVMMILAFLGFTNFSHALPLDDKLLHFFCLGIATGVFYFIFDVEEDARRIWFWRSAPLILTGVFCFFFGGILSEFVQSLLPYKQFQLGDVIANLLGSSMGLCIAYYFERYYRHRREISRLYRPLDADEIPSDDEDEQSTQLLPTHYQPTSSQDTSKGGRGAGPKTDVGRIRLADVWDEHEELFDIGEDSEEDSEDGGRRSRDADPPPGTPKIVITASSA